MEENQKNIPLLDSHNEAEFDKFKKDYKIFISDIDDLISTISKTIYNELTSIQQIKSKFERIGEKMKKLNTNKQYLKEVLIDKDPEKYNQLMNISNKIDKKYKDGSEKITNFLTANDKKIKGQIAEEQQNNQNQLPTLNTMIQVPREDRHLKNLLDIQKEYEQIFKITSELNELSIGIKLQANNQEYKVNNIDDSIINVVEHTEKANEEIKKIKEKTKSTNYWFYTTIIIILSIIVLFLLYTFIFSYWI